MNLIVEPLSIGASQQLCPLPMSLCLPAKLTFIACPIVIGLNVNQARCDKTPPVIHLSRENTDAMLRRCLFELWLSFVCPPSQVLCHLGASAP